MSFEPEVILRSCQATYSKLSYNDRPKPNFLRK